MKSISHLLEDFGETRPEAQVAADEVSLEDERLKSFETGYQAGWDDAVKAQTEDARRITADLAQNLQDLRFTYEEAYSAVMQALHPLLAQMTTTILPRLAHQSLVPRLTEMLHELARDQGRCSVEIAAAPDDMARLGHLLENEPDIGAALVEDDTLGPGQIYLRFGDAEREIDLSATLDGIDAAVAGFFDQHLQERATA